MHADPSIAPPTILSLRPEGCIALDRGVLFSIHRAPIQGASVSEIRAAVARASETHASGLLSVCIFRLSPEFPIGVGVDSNVRELAALLRTLDRVYVANASVIEFDGVLAALMRVVSRSVIALARPRCALADFSCVTDAVSWLRPHAVKVGAPTDPATYLRLYREVDRQLQELDRRRGAESNPHVR